MHGIHANTARVEHLAKVLSPLMEFPWMGTRPCGTVVEHSTQNPKIAGSNPATDIKSQREIG